MRTADLADRIAAGMAVAAGHTVTDIAGYTVAGPTGCTVAADIAASLPAVPDHSFSADPAGCTVAADIAAALPAMPGHSFVADPADYTVAADIAAGLPAVPDHSFVAALAGCTVKPVRNIAAALFSLSEMSAYTVADHYQLSEHFPVPPAAQIPIRISLYQCHLHCSVHPCCHLPPM